MNSNFPQALARVLRHEGGFVHHPQDPGGATNLGVTIGTLSGWRGRPVSVDEVRALSREDVAPIYRSRYWDAVRADELPAGVDYCVFDAAVNSGPRRAATWLQRAIGVTADGVIGVITITATAGWPADRVINRLCDERLAFLKGLSTWPSFGRGWERRVAEVRADALAMAADYAMRVPDPPDPPAPQNDTHQPASPGGFFHAIAALLRRFFGG